MHILTDENGNPVSHGHEHEHMHTHTYQHSHPHSHEHGHEEEHDHAHGEGHEHAHPHGRQQDCEEKSCDTCGAACGTPDAPHGHQHEHTHAIPETQDQMTAVLDYMLKHNEHHAAELDQLAVRLQTSGKGAAAEQIKKAVDEYQKGNLYLGLALSTVKEQK